ncbi:MAG: cytochrome c [Actinomycetota bacterium]
MRREAPGELSLSPEAERGRSLVEERACLSCHSIDGRAGTGPTWKGLAGSTVELADGRTVVADWDYLRRSILDPDADVVVGFPSGLMASVIRPGTLDEAEAEAIVRYLEELR